MNQAQQADRAVRVGRSAQRRMDAHVESPAPSGDLAATYVWAIANGLATIAFWQVRIGRLVAELTTELHSDKRTRETVSELLAFVRLSNASITDYFAIVEAKTTRITGTTSGYVTTERLTDAKLYQMVSEWNHTHGTRTHELVLRNIDRIARQRVAKLLSA